MNIMKYWNTKSRYFCVIGILDKVLTVNGIKYALFFDIDTKDKNRYFNIPFSYSCFNTINGFHAVGFGLHNADTKKRWFNEWKQLFPQSDFWIERGTLYPQSKEELQFIAEQLFSEPLLVEPTILRYYRDKAVFERWEMKK